MTCRDCRKKLSISKFSRNGRKDGYRRPECRSCQHQRNCLNPGYQNTPGAVKARAAHKVAPNAIVWKQQKLKEQNGVCTYCSSKLDLSNCDLDHVIPLSRGGSDSADNYQILCGRCNKEKHAKTHEEYIVWLLDVKAYKEPGRKKIAKLVKECKAGQDKIRP